MASIAMMEAKVRDAERINSELRAQLMELENGVDAARRSWDQLSGYILNTLENGNTKMVQSHERTLQTYELEMEIERIYKLFKNVELSNKKIRECNNKIYYDFANYTRVRKIVEGMLNNIEVSFVSDATLMKAIEVEHLKLPDYWLTCALLSLMAWRSDDRDMAEKALQRACSLDRKNTAIFFFAFYLRMERYSAALLWLEDYIQCERTGEDNKNILFMFSILTKNAGNCDDDRISSSIDTFVQQLIREGLAQEAYHEEDLIRRIREAYDAMIVKEPFRYSLLNQYCTDQGVLNAVLLYAKNNVKILEYIRSTVNITSQQKRNRLNAFIDDVIRRANTTEVEVRNEIRYHETVIRLQGDVETAKAQHEAWLEHNRTELNIISEMVTWVYAPGDTDISPDERERMFRLTSHLSERGAEEYAARYRSMRTDQHGIKIGDYETTANFKDEAGEHTKIETFFRERADAALAQEKIWPCFIWFGVALLAIIGAIALKTPALLVIAAGGILGGVGKILLTKRAKANIILKAQEDTARTKSEFSNLLSEYGQYLSEYESFDAYTDEIQAEFAKL